ncbi:hypothetical protein SOVF_073340 isoform A [Spinacia oleracea]|nr:hypothetical protein SOVF_073340 isoform A [Spinacia oleracea]
MDSQTSDKIRLTVTEILNSSDIDSLTEQQVRHLASDKLNLDLSGLPQKILVRQTIESFLLSTPDDHPQNDGVLPPNLPVTAINAPHKETAVDQEDKKPAESCHVICKLSEKRDVAVRSSGGKTVVSIRELSLKDGKAIPTPTCLGISLYPDQWSIFKKSIPAIEEAITKVESRLRSELQVKQTDDRHGIKLRHRPRLVASRERAVDRSAVASSPQRLVPIEIIRFDGKNYQQWSFRMESYLDQLKVGYVLSESCPSAVGVEDRELAQTLSAAEKWVDDDHICRQNILNSLCDNLYGHYSKKSGTAKDVWEELKLTYLHEEHGAKVSLVKKYIEFQIVEEKPVFEQVHEFHQIADALIASGMYVEEKFHVNVIISKLPPSWKPNMIELMKEDYLPVWMLMNHLKAEEESRHKGNMCDTPRVSRSDLPPVFQPNKRFGPQRIPMKKPGVAHGNYEPDRDRKVKFCSNCKKKGHNLDQCWFLKAEGKDTSNEKDSVASANAAGADTDVTARDSTGLAPALPLT